jgi:hypothetical protein
MNRTREAFTLSNTERATEAAGDEQEDWSRRVHALES